MRNHSLYNIIQDKLSPNVRKKLEKEIESHDLSRKFIELDI